MWSLLFAGCTWITDAAWEARTSRDDKPDTPADTDAHDTADTSVDPADRDGDGYTSPEDCDDDDPDVHPDLLELCDTPADDDCSGSANDADAVGCEPRYRDGDGDGAGDPDDARCLCEADGEWSAPLGDDCDDGDAAVGPGAAEACDGTVDEDCDGEVDEDDATGCVTWYGDGDGDGWGGAVAACRCASRGEAGVLVAGDCDDADGAKNPDAVETCDGVDEDCDGTTDDEAGLAARWDGATWTDVTADVTGASATSPASYALPSTGTLRFCDGTFHVRLVGSGDTVDVESLHGAASTTLDATGTVLSVTDGTVVVRGLTITGGTGTGSTTTYGGGVLAASVSATALTTPNLTLEDCVVTGNAATRGGGVAVYNTAYLRLVDTAVYDNAATDGGGAWIDAGTLACESSGADAGFWRNAATDAGGGAWLSTDGALTSTACDWGTGADDNTPDDVSVAGSPTTYGDDETFALP